MKSKFFKKTNDLIFYIFALVAGLFSIIFLCGIIISLCSESFKAFKEIGIFDFLFGTEWYPTQNPAEFGIFPLIISSILVTILTLIIALPFGLGSAIYISELAKPKEKEILKPFIELLASIPSVIYGLFGMAFLAPFIQHLFNLRTGLNAFTASIILGVMIIPIISSISEDAINTVPNTLRQASLALGANKWETIIHVVLPAARSGIIASIILGTGRAIGETMVVLMIAGNASKIPNSIFSPVRPMTSTIAAEMGETPIGSLHYETLLAIGLVLFIMVLILNLITEAVKSQIKKRNM